MHEILIKHYYLAGRSAISPFFIPIHRRLSLTLDSQRVLYAVAPINKFYLTVAW